MSDLAAIIRIADQIEREVREKDRVRHGGIPVEWVRRVESRMVDLDSGLAVTRRKLHELWSLARSCAPTAAIDAAAFEVLDSLDGDMTEVDLLVGDAADKASELEAFVKACAESPAPREDA